MTATTANDEVDRVLTPAPQGQAAGGVGRAGDVPDDGRALPRHDAEADRRGDPQRQADGVGDQCGPAHSSAVKMPNSAPLAAQAIGVPGRRRPASWPTMAPNVADSEAALRRRWRDRAQQGARPVDRRQHDVGDVGCLERQRATLRAAAQRGEERQRGEHADQCRPVLGDVGDRLRRRIGVADRAADPQHGATAEQGDEVHAVRGVEPLDVAEAMALARRRRRS